MNKNTFLYNTGQITSLADPHFNRRQYYTLTRTTRNGRTRVLGSNLSVPPCNIGPRSTPNYENLAAQAFTRCRNGGNVFAGQRADAFHVDLGAVFDLLDLRPFQNAAPDLDRGREWCQRAGRQERAQPRVAGAFQ